MKALLVAGALALIAGGDAAAAPVEVSVITLTPGRVIAIETDTGTAASVSVSVYNLTATVAVNSAGKPMRNVNLATALAYAKAAGVGP